MNEGSSHSFHVTVNRHTVYTRKFVWYMFDDVVT